MLLRNGFRAVVLVGLVVFATALFIGCSGEGSIGESTLAPQFPSPLRNSPPVIHRIDLSSAAIEPNGTVTVAVHASDPDNDPLTYTYSSSCPNSEVCGTGGQCFWTLNTHQGYYCILVTVSDGRRTTSERAFVTVQPVTHNIMPGGNDH